MNIPTQDMSDNDHRTRIIAAGRAACERGEPLDACPEGDMFVRSWWMIGWDQGRAEKESQERAKANAEAMQDFGAALRLFRHNAAAARASWPETKWLRRLGDYEITMIYASGAREPWDPTHADLLATDWRASSGVVGWTGLDVDINGQPWPPKETT